MPWKQGYTISDEKTISDAELRWPDGNRGCVAIVVDLSRARGHEGIRAADLKSHAAEFAMHDGLDGLLAVLRRFDIKATFAVPAVIAQFMRAASARWLARATRSRRRLQARGRKRADREEEKARLDLTTEILTRVMEAARLAGFRCRDGMTRSPAAPSARTRWIC